MWFEKLASVRVRGFASAVQQEIYNSNTLCVVRCILAVGGVMCTKSVMSHVCEKNTSHVVNTKYNNQ